MSLQCYVMVAMTNNGLTGQIEQSQIMNLASASVLEIMAMFRLKIAPVERTKNGLMEPRKWIVTWTIKCTLCMKMVHTWTSALLILPIRVMDMAPKSGTVLQTTTINSGDGIIDQNDTISTSLNLSKNIITKYRFTKRHI